MNHVLKNPYSYVPITPDDMFSYMANSGAHEIGHNLGLVSHEYFFTFDMSWDDHNPEDDSQYIMNHASNALSITSFDNPKIWRYINHLYLKFILPTKEEDTKQ